MSLSWCLYRDGFYPVNKFTAATVRITKQIYALNCIVDNTFLHVPSFGFFELQAVFCHKNITTLCFIV